MVTADNEVLETNNLADDNQVQHPEQRVLQNLRYTLFWVFVLDLSFAQVVFFEE